MKEHLPIPSRTGMKRGAPVAALLCGLALAGCGNYVNTAKTSIEVCDVNFFDKKGEDQPVTSTSQLLESARADVVTLQKRVLANDDSITLDSPNYARYLLATPNSLTLKFERTASGLGGTATDTVKFPISNNKPEVSAGAIICSEGANFYPNGTYQALQQYVVRTASLNK